MKTILTIILLLNVSIVSAQNKPKKYFFKYVDTLNSYSNKQVCIIKLKNGHIKRVVVFNYDTLRIKNVNVWNTF